METAPDNGQDQDTNVAAALGAEAGVSVQRFLVYVPNKDKDGEETGTQRGWVLEAIRLLSEINGGATAMLAEGGWLNDEGKIILEDPVIVYSHVKNAGEFVKHLPRIRAFLHRMGRETNQGEIAVEFDNVFYRIRTFDPA